MGWGQVSARGRIYSLVLCISGQNYISFVAFVGCFAVLNFTDGCHLLGFKAAELHIDLALSQFQNH